MTNWEIYDTYLTRMQNFDIEWLPSEAYQYLSPRISKSGIGTVEVWLQAKSFVGTIPLTNGDTLYIIPRVGRESFSRMLLLAEGLSDAIRDEFDELARLSIQSDTKLPWITLLSRPFFQRLRLIEKYSLMPGRKNVNNTKNYVKGRISIIPTMADLVRGSEHPIHCSYNCKTYLTPENRVLGTAVASLYSLGIVPAENRHLAMRWLDLVKGNFIDQEELIEVMIGLQSRKYTGYRAYYIPALLMAKLILSQAGIKLGSSYQEIETEALLTNLPILFEKYVRTIIARELTPKGYIVEKITKQSKSLFLDGTCRLEPDILISDATGIKLIADTKYKLDESIDPADYYQMCTYLDAFNVNSCVLILPSIDTATNSPRHRELPSGKKVYELRVPLHSWTDTEDALRLTFDSLLN